MHSRRNSTGNHSLTSLDVWQERPPYHASPVRSSGSGGISSGAFSQVPADTSTRCVTFSCFGSTLSCGNPTSTACAAPSRPTVEPRRDQSRSLVFDWSPSCPNARISAYRFCARAWLSPPCCGHLVRSCVLKIDSSPWRIGTSKCRSNVSAAAELRAFAVIDATVAASRIPSRDRRRERGVETSCRARSSDGAARE